MHTTSLSCDDYPLPVESYIITYEVHNLFILQEEAY